jgi:prepilin-type N-terminal cleavage/methylation domain-containing protein
LSAPRGFSLVELMVATAVLVTVLLGGVSVSNSAIAVAGSSVRTGAAEGRAMRAQTRIRQYLSSAGRSTLFATPPGGGAPELMRDGVPYDNLSFRRTVSAGRAGPVYDPDPVQPPLSFAFEPRPGGGGDGDLVFTTADGRFPICGDVREVEFLREGSRITVRITTVARGVVPPTCEVVHPLVLRNP